MKTLAITIVVLIAGCSGGGPCKAEKKKDAGADTGPCVTCDEPDAAPLDPCGPDGAGHCFGDGSLKDGGALWCAGETEELFCP